jgi:hypothetical protein
MSRREHFDAGHNNPDHSLDGIMSKREQDRIAGEALGGHIWDAMEEMMGGPGSYRASINLQATSHAHEKFPAGNIEFDEEDYPVFRHQVTPDIHIEYPVPHEASTHSEADPDKNYFYATAYKTNARGQKAPLDALYIPGPVRHNPDYIKQSAQEWVDETYTPNKQGYDENARGSYE